MKGNRWTYSEAGIPLSSSSKITAGTDHQPACQGLERAPGHPASQCCPGNHDLSELREGEGKDQNSRVRYLKAGWAPVPVTATLLNMGKETL